MVLHISRESRESQPKIHRAGQWELIISSLEMLRLEPLELLEPSESGEVVRSPALSPEVGCDWLQLWNISGQSHGPMVLWSHDLVVRRI